MLNFGKRPPRALKSFGVAGLLGEECRVFHVPLFSPRHIGRVMDLLSARLRKMQIDEVRLRATLLFTFFDAYQTQRQENPEEPLPEPLLLECGLDAEKVAIGISFILPEGEVLNTDQLTERLSSGQYQGALEQLLFFLHTHAHRVVLRHQPESRRLEIISLLGTARWMDAPQLEGSHQIEIITFSQAETTETPKATAYIELGDLDYSKLLKEDNPGKNQSPSPTGEILARATQPERNAESILVRDHANNTNEVTCVSGVTENISEDTLRIKGEDPNNASEEVFRIQGVTEDIQEEAIHVRDGSPTTRLGKEDQSSGMEGIYKEKIEELQRKIAQLEARRESATIQQKTTDTQGAPPEEEGFWGSLWPFKKKKEVEETPEEPTPDSPPASTTESPPLNTPVTTSEEPTTQSTHPSPEPIPSPELEIDQLERTLTKAESEANEIKKDITSPRAKRWVEGLLSEMLTEKARLQGLAKKLNASIRQKEIEFRSKERVFQDELKKRSEQLRQKNFSISRLKEQLAHTNMMIERLKSASQRPGEDVYYKQKYLTIQKILAATKEENSQLKSKVDDLRSQVNNAQYAAKVRGPSVNDFAAMQGRIERTQRQMDELKKHNQQLNDRLQAIKKERETNQGLYTEMKKRLDDMTKNVISSKHAEQKLKLQMEGMLQTEARLKKELENLQLENKKLKATPPKDSSGTPPIAAA